MSDWIDYTQNLPETVQNAVVAMGNFDGVHKGHQEILKQARAQADQLGLKLVLMSFEPHPRQVFQPEAPNFRLSNTNLKVEALKKNGVDDVVIIPFEHEFSKTSAVDFIEQILVRDFKTPHIFVGEDFLFGQNRQGNIEMLKKYGATHGFKVTALKQIKCGEGQVYSSTAIRSALQRGEIDTATSILGHPWMIESTVEHGDKRGRELGYPTANMRMGSFLHPAYGVYAVRARTTGNKWHNGVANFGIRPMFATQTPLFEAHLIDFEGDLYDQTLRVEFVAYLRPEAKFEDLEALITQMDKDKARAKEILSN